MVVERKEDLEDQEKNGRSECISQLNLVALRRLRYLEIRKTSYAGKHEALAMYNVAKLGNPARIGGYRRACVGFASQIMIQDPWSTEFSA